MPSLRVAYPRPVQVRTMDRMDAESPLQLKVMPDYDGYPDTGEIIVSVE